MILFSTRIKRFGYKIRIWFFNHYLAVENKNYLDKIVNVYIAYDLDSWSRNQVKTFRRKPYLFGTTAIVKPSDKSDKTHQANMCL